MYIILQKSIEGTCCVFVPTLSQRTTTVMVVRSFVTRAQLFGVVRHLRNIYNLMFHVDDQCLLDNRIEIIPSQHETHI